MLDGGCHPSKPLIPHHDDTNKATLIGELNSIYRSADSTSDSNYWGAELYRAPRSEPFFLSARGGPNTIFAYAVGTNSSSSGSDNIPLSVEDAQR